MRKGYSYRLYLDTVSLVRAQSNVLIITTVIIQRQEGEVGDTTQVLDSSTEGVKV